MASDGETDKGFTDQILELGIMLLKDFLFEWIQRHVEGITVTREQLGATEIQEPRYKKVSRSFQLIGDELDGNPEIHSIMTNSGLTPNVETFKKVAFQIFSDGKINWGRIVTLFYFACKFVIKAYEINILEIIKTIISWTVDFLRENVVNWIKQQGGWEGVYSYFGTPTWQMVTVFLAGVLTSVIFMRKM